MARWSRAPAALCTLLLVGCGQDGPPVTYRTDGGSSDGGAVETGTSWIRDAEGGVLILRGTNVSGEAKGAPDFLPPYGRTDLERLRDELGMNAIRLLVFWEAIEPAPGAYDDSYLAAVRGLVEDSAAVGLLVVVDMHQDVFGRGFGHDGAPRWACDESLYASFAPPAEWFLGYFEPEVMACFDRFWSEPATRAAFAGAWARLARELAGAPSVLAYELLNEPSWGSSTPADFDRRIAPDVYGSLVDVIRAEDPGPFIAVEPASSANVGLATQLVPPERERLLYAPHFYPIALERGTGYDGNANALRSQVRRIADDAARLGLPPVVGELGARRDVSGAGPFLADAYDALDEHMVSAFQWDLGRGGEGSYGLWDEAGAPALQARMIARPHPARVAGVPVRWSWDADAGVFEAEWIEDGSATGESVFTLPRLVFPDGATPALDDGGAARVEGARLLVPQIGGARRLTITGG